MVITPSQLATAETLRTQEELGSKHVTVYATAASEPRRRSTGRKPPISRAMSVCVLFVQFYVVVTRIMLSFVFILAGPSAGAVQQASEDGPSWRLCVACAARRSARAARVCDHFSAADRSKTTAPMMSKNGGTCVIGALSS
jgi:hypothetical protein